jgi:hypothetical protein
MRGIEGSVAESGWVLEDIIGGGIVSDDISACNEKEGGCGAECLGLRRRVEDAAGHAL